MSGVEAIVLAGGYGTRLAPRLQGIPKPMAPVAGRPFLDILLAQLERAGCTRVLLATGYLHAVIQEHFGARFHSIELEYSIEESPLGTGGAIRIALERTREPAVLVLNGDTFLDADYAAMMRFHQASGVPLTIAVTRVMDLARYGGIAVENGSIARFEEKGRTGPGFINAGSYIIESDFGWPARLPEKFSFETEILAAEVARLAPAAFEVEGFFLDIGIPEDYDRAQTALAPFAS